MPALLEMLGLGAMLVLSQTYALADATVPPTEPCWMDGTVPIGAPHMREGLDWTGKCYDV